MVDRLPWFERAFPTGLPAHLLPVIVERLRGTPARLADRLADEPHEVLTGRGEGSWSIQENVGHLLDLEPLWRQRVALALVCPVENGATGHRTDCGRCRLCIT